MFFYKYPCTLFFYKRGTDSFYWHKIYVIQFNNYACMLHMLADLNVIIQNISYLCFRNRFSIPNTKSYWLYKFWVAHTWVAIVNRLR